MSNFSERPAVKLSTIASEPVRVYLYGVLIVALAVLVGYGLIDGAQAALWGALGAAVLGVPAVELARSKVTPVAKL